MAHYLINPEVRTAEPISVEADLFTFTEGWVVFYNLVFPEQTADMPENAQPRQDFVRAFKTAHIREIVPAPPAEAPDITQISRKVPGRRLSRGKAV
jgi:hypothetical protein